MSLFVRSRELNWVYCQGGENRNEDCHYLHVSISVAKGSSTGVGLKDHGACTQQAHNRYLTAHCQGGKVRPGIKINFLTARDVCPWNGCFGCF